MLALSIPILPEHVWAKVDPDHLGAYKNLPFVGSGPFRVAELEKGRWVRLEANPDYPDGARRRADARRGRTSSSAQNADAMVEDYKAGALDAIVDFPATYEQLLAEHAGHDDGGRAGRSASTSSASTAGRARSSKGDPLLRDPSIRRAVHWAIDKQKIAATAMAGLAEPGTSLHLAGAGRLALGRARGRAVPLRPRSAPSRSWRTPATPTATATACARTRPATSSSFRLVALNEYPEDQAAAG